MDEIDKRIINGLQGGFPLSERPYRDAARVLGIAEGDLIRRLSNLIDQGVLSRFGPMYDAERMGGAFCLCAMAAPAERFEEIAARVNAHCEVGHNYERAHALNMWFVLAVTTTSEPMPSTCGSCLPSTAENESMRLSLKSRRKPVQKF